MRRTVAQRILTALEHAQEPVCDDCLVPLVGVNRRQQVYSECETLHARHAIGRKSARRSVCGGSKKVSWHAAAVQMPRSDSSSNAANSPNAAASSNPPAPGSAGSIPNGAESLSLGEWRFILVGPIEPDRDAQGQVREFMPQAGYADAQTSRLHRHGTGPFCRFSLRTNVATAGVYLITVGDDIMYVGECADLRDRFGSRGYGTISPRNCYDGGQSTNCKINHRMLLAAQRDATILVWFHETPHRKSIEQTLIPLLRPPWNHGGRGAQGLPGN